MNHSRRGASVKCEHYDARHKEVKYKDKPSQQPGAGCGDEGGGGAREAGVGLAAPDGLPVG